MGYVDYAALKAAVDIEAVAAWLGLDTKRANGQLRCECPKHGGGKRSLVITPAKQLFYCFATDGQTGGDMIELVAHCKDIATNEAALEIEKQFVAAKLDAPDGLQKVAAYLDHGHEAVLSLGLSMELAAVLGIGFAPKGVMRGRVLIPPRTADGTLAGYARYAEALDPKIKFPGKLFV